MRNTARKWMVLFVLGYVFFTIARSYYDSNFSPVNTLRDTMRYAQSGDYIGVRINVSDSIDQPDDLAMEVMDLFVANIEEMIIHDVTYNEEGNLAVVDCELIFSQDGRVGSARNHFFMSRYPMSGWCIYRLVGNKWMEAHRGDYAAGLLDHEYD